MPFWAKILLSIIAGWFLAAALLASAIYLNDPFWSSLLIWHWKPIYALAGNGPLLGYNNAGEPIYEGTPIHILFNLIGTVAGFVIYPIVFLLITSITNFLQKRRAIEVLFTEPPPPPMF